MNVKTVDTNVIITDVRDFDLERTLECGQCFRWNRDENGVYTGVAMGKALSLKQEGEILCLYDTTEDDFRNIWYSYFDFGNDYASIKKTLSEDDVMREAIKYGGGIHLLKQELWETVISFIISASNNIPRIKKIIESLCSEFGDEITYMGNTYHTFPDAYRLKDIDIEGFAPIKAGFRDKYIADAVRRVNSGEFDLEEILTYNNEDARNKLLSVYGIGNKVADCIMLFALSRYSCFPVDVWIKRIMEHFYFSEEQTVNNVRKFAEKKFGNLAGFAQQYLFCYAHDKKIN